MAQRCCSDRGLPTLAFGLALLSLIVFVGLSGCGLVSDGSVLQSALEPEQGEIPVSSSHGPGSPSRALPPIVLSFAGDLMHHDRNRDMPNYDRLYDSVRELLLLDDLSFVNVEFPVDPSREPDGYPIFNGSIGYMEAAIRAGLDVFALANNHTYDLRLPGVLATETVFRNLEARHGVAWNGIPSVPRGAIAGDASPGARSEIDPTTILHRGWTIGFVSVTAFSNVGRSYPHIHLVDYFRSDQREAFLGDVEAWSREYDLLVVAVHAGNEYVTEPVAHKREFFRELADAGADIVWGHHPHVLQPWESRDGRLVLYSAGNFVSAQRRYQNPFSIRGRWAPTGDTTIYQLRVEPAPAEPRVTAVATPSFTMYDHPVHGLVLREFPEVLAIDSLSPDWRRFYEEREQIMRSFLGEELVQIGGREIAAQSRD